MVEIDYGSLKVTLNSSVVFETLSKVTSEMDLSRSSSSSASLTSNLIASCTVNKSEVRILLFDSYSVFIRGIRIGLLKVIVIFPRAFISISLTASLVYSSSF